MPFRQVLTGSMNEACSKETPSGILTTPLRDDPIHYADVFGEAAAAGLESCGRADLLIGGALGINLVAAVIAFAARDVVEDHYAVAGLEIVDAAPTAATVPAVSWPKMRGRSASRWRSSLNPCRRYHRYGCG